MQTKNWLLIPLTLVLFFCNTEARSDQTLIGVLADVSGPTARVGEDCQRGYQLADGIQRADPLHVPLWILYGDNQNDAKVGLSEFRRMVDVEGVVAVVTTRSHIAMAMARSSEHQGIPILGVAAHPLFLSQNPLAFRFITSASKDGKALAQAAISRGVKKVGVITLNDEAYLASSNSFKEEIAVNKLPVIISLEINSEETEFKSIVTKIKATKPDALFINLGAAQLTSFIKKLGESNWKGQILSNFLLAIPDIKRSLGPLIDNALFTESERGGVAFEKLCVDRFGMLPSQLSYSCFVAVSALVQAKSLAPRIENAQEMFQSISSLKRIKVPDGEIEIIGREVQLATSVFSLVHGQSIKIE